MLQENLAAAQVVFFVHLTQRVAPVEDAQWVQAEPPRTGRPTTLAGLIGPFARAKPGPVVAAVLVPVLVLAAVFVAVLALALATTHAVAALALRARTVLVASMATLFVLAPLDVTAVALTSVPAGAPALVSVLAAVAAVALVAPMMLLRARAEPHHQASQRQQRQQGRRSGTDTTPVLTFHGPTPFAASLIINLGVKAE